MRILLIAEYLDAHPWSPSAWVLDIAHALAGRGHDVALACDGCHEPALARPPVRLLIHAPVRRDEARRPLAFARWARRTLGAQRPEAALSFTPLVRAPFNLSLGPSAWEQFVAQCRLNNPVSATFEALYHAWLPSAILAERRARRRRAPGAVALRVGGEPDAPGGHHLGYASRLRRSGALERGALRSRARALLGLSEGREVLLVSAVHPERPGLAPMLEAFREVCAARGSGSPLIVAAGLFGHTVHALARRVGCAERVRLLGSTARMDAALGACDVALAPLASRGSGDTGRFVADALRLGRPVLVDRLAHGAELIAPVPGPDAPGVRVARPDVPSWRAALETAADPAWRARASAAAARAGADLSIDRLVDRLEGILRGEAAGAVTRT